MTVPTPDEVRAEAAEHVPQSRVDQAVAGVLPALRLDPMRSGPVRIGGDAPLSESEDWPVNERGIPLTFIAVVDTAGLPELPSGWGSQVTWRHAGEVLRIFADLLAVPYEPGPARILIAPAGTSLRDVSPPPVPDPWPVDERTIGREGNYDDLDLEDRTRTLPASFAQCYPGLTADTYQFGWEDDPDREGYEGFANSVWSDLAKAYANGSGMAKLLGAPFLVQDDPRWDAAAEHPDLPGEREDWTILLEIHSDWGWNRIDILDGGAYCICVPTAALADGRYEPAICTVQSG